MDPTQPSQGLSISKTYGLLSVTIVIDFVVLVTDLILSKGIIPSGRPPNTRASFLLKPEVHSTPLSVTEYNLISLSFLRNIAETFPPHCFPLSSILSSVAIYINII